MGVKGGAERDPLLQDAVRGPEKEDGGPPLVPPDRGLPDQQDPGAVEAEVAATWNTNISGFRTMALVGLDPEVYSGIPGESRRRQTTGCPRRDSTTFTQDAVILEIA
ncbi:MAG TPA: hypothetical protein VND41_03645 [Nitrososphaerales archaeon]|nr:hypothetical protein [Nitrososphaerales archaeon]